MRLLRRYIPLAVMTLAVLVLASCPDEGQGPDFPIENVLLDFNSAVRGDRLVKVPLDFAGIIHTGYSYNLEREYEMLNEMSARWVHRGFSWRLVQPDVPPDHERFDDFDYLKNENWNFEWLDNFVRRANQEGKQVMGMLLYDTPWVHRKYPRPPGRRFEDRIIIEEETGIHHNIREVRPEQIDYFINYAITTVERFNGLTDPELKVHAWFIWNEPCLQPRFWTGYQDEFFELTKRTASAIRELDERVGTETTLVGGVFSVHSLLNPGWIDGLFASGAMEYMDGIAFHPYGPSPAVVISFYNRFRDLVYAENPAFVDNIWINEIGFPTFPERGPIPPGRQGHDRYEGDMPELVTQTFALLAAAGARNLMWYQMFDRARTEEEMFDSERWFGLVWQRAPNDWVRKGGYWGYALSARHIPGTTNVEMDFFPGEQTPSRFRTLYFEGENGSRLLIVWNDDQLAARDVTIRLGGTNHQLWNVVTGQPRDIGATSSHRLNPANRFLPTLVFITWDED